MRTQLHQIVADAARAARLLAPALTYKDTRSPTPASGVRSGRLPPARRHWARARPAGRDLPRQAHRDRGLRLRRIGRRRGLRAGQPAAAAQQVAHILNDCGARVLVTSPDASSCSRQELARDARRSSTSCSWWARRAGCGQADRQGRARAWDDLPVPAGPAARPPGGDRRRHGGHPLHVGQHRQAEGRRALPSQPLAGAESVSQYLGNNDATTCILAALPLSFDAGFSQLTTAFTRRRPRRARELPAPARRRPRSCAKHRVTGLDLRAAAVDPARRAGLAGRGDAEPALLRQHGRPDAEGDAGRSCAAIFPHAAAVPHVRADRGVPLDLPRPGRGRPAARLDRQGDPQRRDPRRPRRRHARATPARRASSCTAARWSRMGYWNDPERTAERFKPAARRAIRAVLPGARGVVGRHRGRRRRGLPLLRRPQRRDDQDLRLPRQPDRDRGGRCTAPGSSATPSRSASRTPRSGSAIVLVVSAANGQRARLRRPLLAELRQRAAALHGPERRGRSAPAAALAQRQVRPQPAPHRRLDGVTVTHAGTSRARHRRRRAARRRRSPLDRLAARVGSTPFFAYDRALLTERVALLRATLPPALELSYAMKANPMPAVVQHLSGLVDALRRRLGRRDAHRARHADAGRAGQLRRARARPTPSSRRRSRPASRSRSSRATEADARRRDRRAPGHAPARRRPRQPRLRGQGLGHADGRRPAAVRRRRRAGARAARRARRRRPRPPRASTSSPARRTCTPRSSARRSARPSSSSLRLAEHGAAAGALRSTSAAASASRTSSSDEPLDLGPIGRQPATAARTSRSGRRSRTARVVVELGRYLVGECRRLRHPGRRPQGVARARPSWSSTAGCTTSSPRPATSARSSAATTRSRSATVDRGRRTRPSASSAACARRSTCSADNVDAAGGRHRRPRRRLPGGRLRR